MAENDTSCELCGGKGTIRKYDCFVGCNAYSDAPCPTCLARVKDAEIERLNYVLRHYRGPDYLGHYNAALTGLLANSDRYYEPGEGFVPDACNIARHFADESVRVMAEGGP